MKIFFFKSHINVFLNHLKDYSKVFPAILNPMIVEYKFIKIKKKLKSSFNEFK